MTLNCPKCKTNFRLISTNGNEQTFECNCVRRITITSGTGSPELADIKTRLAILEAKVNK